MENWNNSYVDIFKNMSFTDRPPSYKYLRFLIIYNEHNALLGATNMSDIVWAGVIWHYNDISNFSKEKAAITKQIDHGFCDAVYLAQDKFITVGDQGDVEIFQIVKIEDEQHSQEFQSLHRTCQHDDVALTVSLFFNKRNIVTGGMDCCIKVWDVEDLIATYSYNYAHTRPITSTDVKPMCNSIFVSAASSGDALLWDIRRSKPAHCIFKRDSSLTTVAWEPASDYLIAIGDDEGKISLIDIRQTNNSYETVKSDRGVHKLLFNPERKKQLACCFDNTSVKVLDTSKEMRTIFKDNTTHKDFVQGLAWHKDNLFSCAWDGSVMEHMIPSNDN